MRQTYEENKTMAGIKDSHSATQMRAANSKYIASKHPQKPKYIHAATVTAHATAGTVAPAANEVTKETAAYQQILYQHSGVLQVRSSTSTNKPAQLTDQKYPAILQRPRIVAISSATPNDEAKAAEMKKQG